MSLDTAELEGHFYELHARHPAAPALLVCVRRDDQLWSRGYGAASDSTFRIASVTKTFVATSLLRLVELKELSLTDTLQRHLGEQSLTCLTQRGYDVRSITLEHLLEHTSGLPDHSSTAQFRSSVLADPDHRWTRLEQLALAVEQPAHGSPGKTLSYSDTGYILLGETLERITSQRLGTAVRELLRLDRLGLRATWWEIDEDEPKDAGPRVAQFAGELDTRELHPSLDLFGGGGMVSTTEDLTRFVEALFGGEVLGAAGLEQMMSSPHAVGSGGWGRGLFRLPDANGEWWGHTGFWGAAIGYLPANRTAVALLTTQLPAMGGVDIASAVDVAR